jgi:hypothetical protein
VGFENAHGYAQNAENGFDHKDDNEFLSHIVRVIADKTWVSFLNIETKKKSKQ